MSLGEQECKVLVPEDVFLSKEHCVLYFPVLLDFTQALSWVVEATYFWNCKIVLKSFSFILLKSLSNEQKCDLPKLPNQHKKTKQKLFAVLYSCEYKTLQKFTFLFSDFKPHLTTE